MLKVSFSRNVLAVAGADRDMACGQNEWDQDKMILGVPRGYIDLTTGKMCAGRPRVKYH